MAVMERGSFFPPELVAGLISKVQGHSSLAVLSAQNPIPFNGLKEFTFNMDSEIDIVAESGPKSHGGISMGSRTVVPLKVEYGARVSDEFMFSAEEEQIAVLEAFSEGFARKLARGFDLMAYHGINPRTGNLSTLIGTNCFTQAVQQKAEILPEDFGEGFDPDDHFEGAISLIRHGDGFEGTPTGMIVSPTLASMMAQVKVNGVKAYPEFSWGRNPGNLNGLQVEVNSMIMRERADSTIDLAIVGDFRSAFRWGYAKQIPLEVIPYGDPDNSGMDLKGHNQVYIRCEAYLGWAIHEPKHFARVTASTEDPTEGG